jgi:hypothetical protein
MSSSTSIAAIQVSCGAKVTWAATITTEAAAARNIAQLVRLKIRSHRLASTSARTKNGMIHRPTLWHAWLNAPACPPPSAAGSSRCHSTRSRAANWLIAALLYSRNSPAASSTRAARSRS